MVDIARKHFFGQATDTQTTPRHKLCRQPDRAKNTIYDSIIYLVFLTAKVTYPGFEVEVSVVHACGTVYKQSIV